MDLIKVAGCIASLKKAPVLNIIKKCNSNFEKMYSCPVSMYKPRIVRKLAAWMMEKERKNLEMENKKKFKQS